MFNNFFLLDFTNKTERIDCEYFHLDTFAYQPQKEYKYTKVFTREDFETREEYITYLNNSDISNTENRYTSSTHKSSKPIGTFLFEFLDTDFSKPNTIGKLTLKYGPVALNSYLGNHNEFLDKLEDKDETSISQEDFEWLYKESSVELLPQYRQLQNDLQKIIDFVYNLNEEEYLENLTPSQRYFIFINTCRTKFRTRIFEYVNNIEITQDIDYSSLYDLNIKGVDSIEELANIIKKKDKKNHHYKISTFFYSFSNLASAYYYCVLHFIENNITIKKCKNCGNYFIPENRSSSIYCNRKFEGKKTCKDIGAINTYNEKLKKDEVNSLYRKTLSAKKMLANRNPDIPMYLERYEVWKTTANKFKQDIKNGLKTNEEFKEWIEKTK